MPVDENKGSSQPGVVCVCSEIMDSYLLWKWYVANLSFTDFLVFVWVTVYSHCYNRKCRKKKHTNIILHCGIMSLLHNMYIPRLRLFSSLFYLWIKQAVCKLQSITYLCELWLLVYTANHNMCILKSYEQQSVSSVCILFSVGCRWKHEDVDDMPSLQTVQC